MSFRQDEASAGTLVVQSSDEIIARLDDLLRGGVPPERALLAFDADGTLWEGDVGIDAFEALLAQHAVRHEAASALRAEAAGAGLPIEDDPTSQARVLYEAFARDAYDEERAFLMMTWVFAGFREDEMRAFARAAMHALDVRARLHPEVLPILAWAASRGVARYVVSASPAPIVRAALDHIALPVEKLIAMNPAVEGGRLAPRITEPATYGAGKPAALREQAHGYTILGAFGDSPFDLPLLGAARVGVAVRPKPKLRAQAHTCPGLTLLAPAER